ncbi:MAG: efflux RND transporter periplasmic adaptor subunit [Deltaproteobacteria bacterium]|nr:efflux RND transporter periplasmic adaptor subunit [Deltaproteobacteria bacterium]
MRRALCIALVLGACAGNDDIEPGPAHPPAVRRDAGVSDAAPPSRGFVGVIAASESIDIAPLVAGRIAAVDVRPGDQVKRGDVVAVMDPTSMQEEMRAAQAALGAAQAAFRQAAVDVEDAGRKVALEKKGVADGVSSQEQYDQAVIGLKRAKAAADRAAATAAAEKSRLETARDHVGNTKLMATFDGIVQVRLRDPGATVQAGEPIVRILGRAELRLRFAVPAEIAKALAVGTAVIATVDGIATPVPAVVRQVSPALDAASGMILIEAELAADPAVVAQLRPSLAAWVRLP